MGRFVGRKADPQTDPPDIVAELDRWLDMIPMRGDDRGTLRRARDEIVALRAERDVITRLVPPGGARFTASYVDAARAEALEEAAQVCEEVGIYSSSVAECIVRIRARKEMP